MKFVDDNFACALVLHEHGTHGIQLKWNCIPKRDYEVEGFLICYVTGDSTQVCRQFVSKLSDDDLMKKVANGEWAYNNPDEDHVKIACLNYTSMQDGFSVMNQQFRAPCKIEIWTVARREAEIYLFAAANADTVCYRKLSLKKQFRVDHIPPQMGGFLNKKVIKEGSTNVEIIISSTDTSANYIDGAVGYTVPGCRYVFPIAKETLGKKIQLVGIGSANIEINKKYSKLYEFTD